MSTFKRLISAVETADQIMKEQNDNESNAVDIVILSPDNVELLKDDEEVQNDDVITDNGLPSDACCMVQIQTNFLNGEGSHY